MSVPEWRSPGLVPGPKSSCDLATGSHTIGWRTYVVTFWSLPTALLSAIAAAAGMAMINSVGNLPRYFGP